MTSTPTPSRAFSTPVKHGDVAAIRALASEGVPLDDLVDALPRHQCTPLTLAADVKRIESVTALLDVGADIDAADPMGRTPLEAALLAGGNRDRPLTIAIVEELVTRGAKVTDRALERVRNTYDAYGSPAYPPSLVEKLEHAAQKGSAR